MKTGGPRGRVRQLRARAWLASRHGRALGMGTVLGAASVLLGLGACSSAGDESLAEPSAGTWTSSTSSSAYTGYGGSGVGTGTGTGTGSWTTTTTATGTGTGAATGTGTGTGTATGTGTTTTTSSTTETDTGDGPGQDAGTEPDAAVACDALDSSQPVVLYLSADDSNSMSSPVHNRDLLRSALPPRDVRTYEFLNYYRIDYPSPPVGQLSLFAELEPAATAGDFDLQLAVRSFDAISPRRAMTITFVLDTSGSMQGNSIARERAVVRAVAHSLAAGDVVNMVTWSDTQSTVLAGHVASGPDDPLVLAAADALAPDGATDLHAGLVAGYALANAHYGPSRINRVVLVSDGAANTGITDEQLIADNSEDADHEGIYLVGVGTGPAQYYNDQLMDTVTDRGRGAYVYLDSELEAEHMFHERFDETMEVAARAVAVELTLPWYFQMHRFYGEEYSDNPADVEPQHLAPSDAMIFNQVLRACDPAIVSPTDTIGVVVHWTQPLTYQPRETAVTLTVGELLAAQSNGLAKGRAIVAYAEALKAGTADALSAAYEAAEAADPQAVDGELVEIRSLLALHPEFP